MKISRRRFITSGAGIAFSSAQLSSLGASALDLAPGRSETANSKIFVIVQLCGGNDGLNTIVPYGFAEYYQGRPNLAIPRSDVLPLTNMIGFNPQMHALKEIYDAGQLAVVLGVGYPNQSRSHFRANEIWQTAQPEMSGANSWLARYVDHLDGDREDAAKRIFPAINVEPVLDNDASFDQIMISSLDASSQFWFNTDVHYQIDKQKPIGSFPKSYKNLDLSNPKSRLFKILGTDEQQTSAYAAALTEKYRNAGNYPANGFGHSMEFIAQMITAGIGAQIYKISLGGFDTHTNQSQTLLRLHNQLSESLAAFQKDLIKQGVDQNVILLVFSEFGRSLRENDCLGTDHGTASPAFIMGSAIEGGIYGKHPSLTDLDQGTIKYEVDFRTVYATIIDRWLSVDSKQVLGNKFEHLAFI